MIRLPRAVPLAIACMALLVACQPRTLPPAPVSYGGRAAPSAAPGLETVHGDWEADRPTPLHASPSAGAPVVATLQPGQPVTVLGRVRGSDWLAVRTASGATAHVRLHLLRLHGSAPPMTARGATTVLPKAEDNAGPAVKAAPRRKIEAAPLS
jgi:hypothetical protein